MDPAGQQEERVIEAAVPVIVLESAAAGDARVAGVPALARVLREFAAAGVRRVELLVEDGSTPGGGCRAEAARLAPGLGIDAVTADAAVGGTAFSGAHLIPADTIRRFLTGPDECLVWSGRIVAAQGGPRVLGKAAQPDNLRAEDVIPLAPAAAATRTLLRRTAKASDGPVARWLNRPVSQHLSAAALRLPWLRPDHVTILTALIAAAMFACFVFGGPSAVVVGGILFHVASVVDGVDGEIARVTFRSSLRGAVLDMIVDRATILAFFLGISLAAGRLYGLKHGLIGLWGFAAAAIGVAILSQVLRRLPPPRSYSVVTAQVRRWVPGGAGRAFVEAMNTLISRDVFSFVLPVMIVLGRAWLVPWTFTAFTTVWLFVVLATVPAILRGAPIAVPPAEPRPTTEAARPA
jgi:CDP-L-myo-inositol myo-inositolphosphotransferase